MKGTEGIDYVVTECGHCSGEGKCGCYSCRYEAAVRAVADSKGVYFLKQRDEKMEELQAEEVQVKCTICRGVGKVVFWREEPEAE
jgi:hypothetical protein